MEKNLTVELKHAEPQAKAALTIHNVAANALEIRFVDDGSYFAEITHSEGAITRRDFERARLVTQCYALADVARGFIEGCERGEHVGEAFFSRLLDRARAAIAQVEGGAS